MQYTGFVKDDMTGGLLFKSIKPIEYASSLISAKLVNKTGTFRKEEFRWSFNTEYWSPWTKLTDTNIAKVDIKEPLLYIEFRFIFTTTESGSIDDIELNYFSKTQAEIDIEHEESLVNDNHNACCSPDNVPLLDKVIKHEIVTVDDAELLNRKDGKYYLNRANHFGQQDISTVIGLTEALEKAFKTNIRCYNVPLIYDYAPGVFYNQDGSTVYFKRIIGDPSTISVTEDVSGYIKIKVKTDILPDPSYNTILPNDLPMPNSVGGYPAGTLVSELKNKNYTSILDQLLFPVVHPTFIDPFVTTNNHLSTLQEIDTSLNINLTSNFNRGLITVQNYPDRFRAGLPYSHIFNTDTSTITVLSSNLSETIIYPYKVIRGLQLGNWNVIVNYSEGDQPINSYGINDGTPLQAGNVSRIFKSIEGVYAVYATVNSVLQLIKLPLHSMLTPNSPYLDFNLEAEIGGRQQFALATEWYNTIPINKIQTFNTLSGQFQDSDMSVWHITDIIIDDYKMYKLFTYNGAIRSNVKIRLIF